MKQLIAFTKKEFLELIRTGKIYILLIIFVIFGIMNPALAKLTPWMFEMLADTMKEQGIILKDVTVTAMTSWEQYYKNMSMEFIVLVVMFCGILTSEYQKGTLINMLTKGLPRWKVILSKSVALFTSWSICYWLTFGITYTYNAYFWDNSIAKHLVFSAMGSYLFGLWLLSLILLCSAFLNSSSAVLLSTGVVYVITYLISMVPKLSDVLPIKLTAGMDLLNGNSSIKDYRFAFALTIILILIGGIATVVGFNRKRI
ncbi:ABC transporter permease [Lachnoclostridium sp.]|uniref:ABC transporter permease n=1 Tax=Lachnoclostridium sp. TaxID=2028282 RepID=UPI00289833D5|nr:ABC transporter permease subunit [Lachnoclostridium sp.]